MKQHISVEQLNELSDKGKERLCEWWKPSFADVRVCKLHNDGQHLEEGSITTQCYSLYHPRCKECKEKDIRVKERAIERGYDVSHEVFPTCYHNRDNMILPLLSIGQMIEFLDEHIEYKQMILTSGLNSEMFFKRDTKWFAGYGRPQDSSRSGEHYYSDELCDALWEPTRDILNNADDKTY